MFNNCFIQTWQKHCWSHDAHEQCWFDATDNVRPFLFFFSPCRYGEHSTPFRVSAVDSCRRGDGEFSRRVHDAVERASLDVRSGSSSEEEEEGGGDTSTSSSNVSALFPVPAPPTNPEPKTIPTVSNPNSVYRVGWPHKGIFIDLQPWSLKWPYHPLGLDMQNHPTSVFLSVNEGTFYAVKSSVSI